MDGESPLEVQIGFGSGQQRTPFTYTHAEFVGVCERYEFSHGFLSRIPGKKSLLGHRFQRTNANPRPSRLEIAAASYKDDGFLCRLRGKLGNGDSESGKVKYIKVFDPVSEQILPVGDILSRLGR